MKVLLVHNYYGSSAPSGENTVFEAERSLLERHGHELVTFTRNSDDIRRDGWPGTLRGALCTPWNHSAARRLRHLIEQVKPDIMHVHNTFPLISPSIFHAAGTCGTPAVLTLHNYRIFCASAILLRDDRPCTVCLQKRTVLPALRHGCYRKSKLSTAPLALMIALHRMIGTWSKKVDAFIALTGFQKELMGSGGIPPQLIYVKPNFLDQPVTPVAWSDRDRKVLFIGRLSSEKGVRLLIDAWRQWGDSAPLLEIIGEGPEGGRLRAAASGLGTVQFSGALPFHEVQKRLSRACLLVLPSICFEGFPMVIPEAFALGVPVAGSALGAIESIVLEDRTGILFAPGESEDLMRKVKALWHDEGRLAALADNARREFQQRYTSSGNYEMLMKVYDAAMARRRGRPARTGET